jgi:hypothetical protein
MAVTTREPRNPTRVVPSIYHIKGHSMKDVAKKCANDLVKAALKKKRWTPKQSKQWTRAFNALRRLSDS